MLWALIPPIFRSTRLCVTACGKMHPRCCQPVAWKLPLPGYRLAISWMHYTTSTSCNTQSSAPEDGQDQRPKHVELIGIINKPLLLHLVGCLYYLYQWCTVKQISSYRFQATGRQHRGCIIPQAVAHSLVLLKTGGIKARKVLSWLELLINRYCCI